MVPPPQALLTSLVVKLICPDEGPEHSHVAKMNGDTIVNDDGVEIIASNDANGHLSHAVYPCFGDRPPDAGLEHAHVVYPMFGDSCGGLIGEKMKDHVSVKDAGIEIIASKGTNGNHSHAVYPAFDSMHEAGGLIREKAKGDAIVKDDGIEIIVSNGANGDHSHAVYPRFRNRPPDEASEHSHDAHVVYPMLGDDFGGLIGERVKDAAIVNNDGIDMCTSNGAEANHSHATYPHFGNRPPDEGLEHSHVVYPVLGGHCGGLIGEKAKGDAIVSDDGIEIIACAGFNGNCPHAVYPHFGDKPEEGRGHLHILFPGFGDSGLIGEKTEEHTVIENRRVETIASDDTYRNYPVVVYPSFCIECDGLIGERVSDGTRSDLNRDESIASPDEGLIGERVSDGTRIDLNGVEFIGRNRAVHPTFDAILGGLIGGDVKDGTSLDEGLIGERVSDVACNDLDGVEIIASKHAVHPTFDAILGGLIGGVVQDGTFRENRSAQTTKHPEYERRPHAIQDLIEHNDGTNSSNGEAKAIGILAATSVAKLLEAFFALPRDKVLHVMRMATEKDTFKLDAPCTGCGAQHEQRKVVSDRLASISPPTLVATS